ncbi:hypothetical protein LS74_010015 [Helicobacter magdeburgensis]|uniref:Uncharacterized protein n=1 Tax=Helicobacter magdeburgensis TaxID=471858 RepID=A0A4U8SW55_9HELI|nr:MULTISPECIES: hypothetical protein [Helicobacter]TLD91154.1 hypothetical protein LS74_010015 [Helicobacter magdeburgensis]BDB63970.1 hypothetical protein T36_0417 [Helicobacter cinaedi]
MDLNLLYGLINKENVFIFVMGFVCGVMFCRLLYGKKERKAEFVDSFCDIAPVGFRICFVNSKRKHIICQKCDKLHICSVTKKKCKYI